ncbi:MAG: DUF2063 domain-containing protein [Alphaproteobacteria bacterium]|nr:DUF2063 domain-containing protein [Alphaproteobacteria bacterium]
MRGFAHLLDNFHHAIVARDAGAVVDTIKPNPRITPEQQMAIYIGGYRLRLIAALKSDYPALAHYWGNAEFENAARSFIECTPSTYFNLDKYPHQFAHFIAMRGGDDFAAELAELEGAIAEVFMDEESAALQPSDLSGLTDKTFGELVLRPRAASRLLTFSYPVDSWLTAEREGKNPARPEPETTYLYVYRHNNEVRRAPLSAAAHTLLSAIISGKTVASALDANPNIIPAELQLWFCQWVSEGFFRS